MTNATHPDVTCFLAFYVGILGIKTLSNIGEVENQGFELSLNWTKQFGKDLTLDLRGNFTYNQNEYKYVDEQLSVCLANQYRQTVEHC